jgi:hypothetical protein
MPYKDPEQKREWERLHRPQRLARRRELRRVEAAQPESQRNEPSTQQSGVGILVPLVAGGALAAYNPKLGMGASGLTLGIAAVYKKDWRWWIVGAVILALSLFFYWNNKNAAESGSGDMN